MSICKKVLLGSLPFGVPEIKIEWQGTPIPRPVTYTRQSKVTAYAELCGPEDVLNSFWEQLRSCAIGAATAAGLSTIIAGPQIALPAFQASFVACVDDKAKSVQVGLSTEQEVGGWVRVSDEWIVTSRN